MAEQGDPAQVAPRSNEHIEFTVRAKEDLFLVGTQRTELRVQSQNNYSCLMLKTQKFSSLFRHYAKYHGLRKDDLEYTFVERLELDDTPEGVQLQRGDVIEVSEKKKSPPSPIRSNDESYRLDLLGLLADTDSRSGLHDCVFLVDKEKEDLGELKESIMSPSSLKKREEPEEVWAHKAILTARGEYFKGCFKKGLWKESEGNVSYINVGSDFNKGTIKRMLEWVYTNRIYAFTENSTAQEALDLLRLADKWILKDLKRLCEYRLMSLIDTSNVSKLLSASETYDARRLQKSAVQYCLQNIKEVTGSKSFEEEIGNYPHLCIGILTEAAEIMPERKRKFEHVVKEEEGGG
ncbi:hypothetical protein TrVE_jg566 [Triparma verrucosa]|uniref:BTB domain-containing protein n=2 Tax=Triparma TaxID=722752 RepID=A0A9W7A9G5_9STRA|nr:hypothetical protein TrST_g4378 [Triparma strigata]GMI00103.1 hypothetical protein TrVE_jg566 [Triparma verrucosa]